MTVHACPWCRCLDLVGDGIGRLDPLAPFHALVLECDRLAWEETTAKHVATRAARKDAAA